MIMLTLIFFLLLCASKIPLEFNGQCRSLDVIKRWKATEFRTFLLYVGPLVLLNKISRNQYEQFLSLSIAMSILSLDLNYLDSFAHKLLVFFVKSFSRTYRSYLVSHNVHGLLHLFEDYTNFGSLDNINCFPLKIIYKRLRNK
jgi:hypothetical protein